MGRRRSLLHGLRRYLAHRSAGSGYRYGKKTRSKVLRILFLLLAAFILFLGVGTYALIQYSVSRINTLVQSQNFDLLALEQLLREKVIVLSEQQKEALIPLVKRLRDASLDPRAEEKLKRQMWQVLDSAQVKKLEEWRSQAKGQAGGIFSSGKEALSEVFKRYSDAPGARFRHNIDNFSAWGEAMLGSVQDKLLESLAP